LIAQHSKSTVSPSRRGNLKNLRQKKSIEINARLGNQLTQNAQNSAVAFNEN
jgi:hypothetical protein